jgi:dolichol-phosphate mannosyltransferase
MKLMDEDVDVVYGQRTKRKGDSPLRKAASDIFYRLLQKLSDVEIPLDTGDFRLMSRRVLDVLLSMPEHHRFIRGMISWIGYKQVPVYYERGPRAKGETSYDLKRLFSFAIDAFTGFSVKPLRFAMFLGIGTASVSLIYVAYIIVRNITFGTPVEGWASLMAAILLLSGIQMMILGLLGEYLGRVFQEVKKRPLFVISEIVSPQDDVKD